MIELSGLHWISRNLLVQKIVTDLFIINTICSALAFELQTTVYSSVVVKITIIL